MSARGRRLLTALATLLAVGAVATFALAAQGPADPPSIALDSSAPLFELQGMVPGAPPTERCIALTAQGGVATRLEVSGTVQGTLARKLRMEVEGGASPSPAPGAARSCAGFVSEQTLWTGTLDAFPQEGAPAVSTGALAAGQRRVFRFRVWLPAGTVVAADEVAHQSIRWRADLDGPADAAGAPQPPAGTPSAPDAGGGAPSPARGPDATRPDGVTQRCGARLSAATRCRGRLIVRVTQRGARLHARIHAAGAKHIRAASLLLPAALPGSTARIAVLRARPRGGALELAGRVRAARSAGAWRLTFTGLPARAGTVLLRVRVPPAAHASLTRAACRRAPVSARLTTSAGPQRLTGRMWIAAARCRG